MGFIPVNDGVAPARVHGALVATGIPTVAVLLDPPTEMVTVAVEDSSPLVVDKSVATPEDGAGVTAELTGEPGLVTVLKDRELELEGTVLVNEGVALELEVTVTFGD